jgi:DNA-binding response OmpR family regulator
MAATIKVLTVEDDDDDADLLAFALEQTPDRDYELRRARNLSEMHRALASFQPDIVLLDLHLPD